MPQPPFLTDAVQFEPGSGDVLVIERDSVTGGLLFRDPAIPGGVTLTDLAGTASVGNVRIVGPSGVGAEFASIQAALDDIPDTSSVGNPHVILVYAGEYVEDVVVSKDGVAIVGFGRVSLSAASGGHTIVLREGASSTPQWARIQGIRISNSSPQRACIFIDGNSGLNVAVERHEIFDCDFVATGVDGYQILASGASNIHVKGGTCEDSILPTSIRVDQCNQFFIDNMSTLRDVWFAYDVALNAGAAYSAYYVPPSATNHYRIQNATTIGNIEGNIVGAGGLCVFNTPEVGNLLLSGDREVYLANSVVGDIDLDVGTPLRRVGGSRGDLTGLGIAEESRQEGVASFVAVSTQSVTFPVPHPDVNYTVALEPNTATRPFVTSKTPAGFDIEFAAPQTTAVRWVVTREV